MWHNHSWSGSDENPSKMHKTVVAYGNVFTVHSVAWYDALPRQLGILQHTLKHIHVDCKWIHHVQVWLRRLSSWHPIVTCHTYTVCTHSRYKADLNYWSVQSSVTIIPLHKQIVYDSDQQWQSDRFLPTTYFQYVYNNIINIYEQMLTAISFNSQRIWSIFPILHGARVPILC